MERMAPDQPPAPTAPAAESVVEFGTEPPASSRRRRRFSTAGLGVALAGDRRVVPLAAALGALAVFGSLISEWQVTAIDATAFGGTVPGNRTVAVGLADLDGWGAGYLVGLLVLVTAAALVLFGRAGGRRQARLIGLSSAGLLLAMLVAVAQTLNHASRAIQPIYTLALTPDQLRLSYGRGLWCAFVGVLAVGLALYLAGRHIAADQPDPAPAAAGTPAAEALALPTVWSWRRPRPETNGDRSPAAPFDLTVSPTTPFTSLGGADRDTPEAHRDS